MARQSKKHFIQLGDDLHRLSAERWNRAVAAGLCLVIADRLARPRNGVQAELRGGELWFLNPAWIYTSWLAIDQIAPVRGKHYERDLADQYEDPRGARTTQRYGEIRTGMMGWSGTIRELAAHVKTMNQPEAGI